MTKLNGKGVCGGVVSVSYTHLDMCLEGLDYTLLGTTREDPSIVIEGCLLYTSKGLKKIP